MGWFLEELFHSSLHKFPDTPQEESYINSWKSPEGIPARIYRGTSAGALEGNPRKNSGGTAKGMPVKIIGKYLKGFL